MDMVLIKLNYVFENGHIKKLIIKLNLIKKKKKKHNSSDARGKWYRLRHIYDKLSRNLHCFTVS